MQLILDGEIQLIVNTPYGTGTGGNARLDGYEIRTAAVRANVPCITTVQGLGAAVQGIEARMRGDVEVRSLQSWAQPVSAAYSRLFEHGFRRLDPERAHHVGMTAIRAARPVLARRAHPGTPVRALGLTFPHALGLAAGFDKNAVAIDALAGLGFGHVEVGTVTGRPQPGNPQPRLFRLPNDRAVVNRMGFNNDGAAVVAARQPHAREAWARPRTTTPPARWTTSVLGVNIGKTKVVPEDDEAAVLDDYGRSARLLAPHADYLVVNVSSPNTPGLRSLQAVERLRPLLDHVRDGLRPRRRPARAAAGEDRTRPRRRRRRRRRRPRARGGPRRDRRHEHHGQPGGPAQPPRPGGRGRRRAACRAVRSPRAPPRCCGCCANGSGPDPR